MENKEAAAAQNAQNANSVSNAEIKEVKLSSLERHPDHKRIYSEPSEKKVQDLASDIKERGGRIPIVVNKDNKILSGYLRFLAALLLGFENIIAMVISIAKEDEIEFIIGSNPEREKTIHDEVNEVMALRVVYLKKKGQNNDGEHTNKIISMVTGHSTDKIAKIVKIQEVCPALFNDIAEGKISLHSANEKAKLLEETGKLQEMMDQPPVVIKDTSKINTAFMDVVKDYAEKEGRPELVAMMDDKVLKPKEALSYIEQEVKLKTTKEKEDEEKKAKGNTGKEETETPVISMCPLCGAKIKKKEDQEGLTEHYPKILRLKEDLGMSA